MTILYNFKVIEMYYFEVNDREISIENKYVNYSPYLKTLVNTQVRTESYQSINQEIVYILDLDPILFDKYVRFLTKGDVGTMTDELEEFYDFMGHINYMSYPLDYWAIKLHDNYIRDFFYIDHYTGFHDLHHIHIDEDARIPKIISEHLGKGIVIAGGYAMYLAGYIPRTNDIDIFVTDKTVGTKLINELNESGTQLYITDNAVSFTINNVNYQIILRVYSCPSEVVHGFDLDCVGILYTGRGLYSTKRAQYSNENRTNWYDPERASASYEFRLSKYNIRGYNIGLKDLDKINFNYKDLKETLLVECFKHPENDDDISDGAVNICNRFNITDLNDVVYVCQQFVSVPEDLVELCRRRNIINAGDIINAVDTYYIHRYDTVGELINRIGRMSSEGIDIIKSVPTDRATCLLLAKYDRTLSYIFKHSDYVPGILHDGFPVKKTSDIDWKVQNPMEQLSGTFNPEPFTNMLDFYLQSPLVTLK